MRSGWTARRWAAWLTGLAGFLLVAGSVACAAGTSRAGRRPTNASVVIVARGMLEGTLTPIG